MHRELLLFQCVSAAQTWVALHRQWELQQHPRRIPHRSKNMGHRAPLGPCQWTKVVVQNPKCIQVRVVRFTLEWPWWSRGPCSNLQCLKAKQPQGKELRKNNVCSCLGGGGPFSRCKHLGHWVLSALITWKLSSKHISWQWKHTGTQMCEPSSRVQDWAVTSQAGSERTNVILTEEGKTLSTSADGCGHHIRYGSGKR
jgi:hypothetical protein